MNTLFLREGMVFKDFDPLPNVITHEDSGYTIIDYILPENNVTDYDDEIKEVANGIYLPGDEYFTKMRIWINLGLVNEYSYEYYRNFKVEIESICKKTSYRSFLETLRPVITEKAAIALNSMENIKYEKVLFVRKDKRNYEITDKEEILDLTEKVTKKIIKDEDPFNFSNLLKRALNYKFNIVYIYWQYKIKRLNNEDSHKTLLPIIKKIAERYVEDGQEKYPDYFFDNRYLLKYDIVKHELDFIEERLKVNDKNYR